MKTKLMISGILIVLVSAVMYFSNNHYWYYPAVYGVWFIFDTLSKLRGNKTTIDIFLKDKKMFFTLYLYLFILGVLIELIGSIILKLWNYPLVNPWILYTIGMIGYPIILISFRETYTFLRSFIKNTFLSVIASMLVGILIWEVPIIYSKDWVYSIPLITLELFHINIVVIIGWVILIACPLFVYKMIE